MRSNRVKLDEHLDKIKEKMKQGKEVDFKIHDDGSLRLRRGDVYHKNAMMTLRDVLWMRGITLHIMCTLGDKLYKDLKVIY